MITMFKIKDKIIFLLLLNILIFNSSFTGTDAYISSELNIEEYQWKVKPDSSLEFEVSIDSNSSINTTVDGIIQEYLLLNLTENIKGNKAFEIKTSNITYKYNLSEIAQDILNFTGPIMVERLNISTWEPIQRYTLPFFIPIDHWDELEVKFNELLPNATWIDLEYFRLLDEYKYSMSWYDINNGFVNDYWYQWNGYNGVLSGFGISISNESDIVSGIDSVSIEISAQYIPDTEPAGNPSSLIISMIILILFLSVGTFILYYIGERRGTLYKKKDKPKKNNNSNENS